jgi:hypothetical protein
MRQGFPKVIDPVGLADRYDIVIHGAHFGRSVGVFYESQGGHTPDYRTGYVAHSPNRH